MEGIEISEPHNLFDVLKRVYESSGSRPRDSEVIFTDYSVVDARQTVSSDITLSGICYKMFILLSSEDGPLDFSSHVPFFERGLKRRSPEVEFIYQSERVAYIRRYGQNIGLYGVRNGSNEGGGFLEVFCGTAGLFPRTLAKREEFVETIREITSLANLFFEPFVKRNGEGIMHFLTLTRE